MKQSGTQTNKYVSNGITHTIELVEEVPIAISVNALNYAVILITPVDVEAFVLGFAYSEGLINSANEVLDMTIEFTEQADASIPPHIKADLQLTGRAQHRTSSIMRQRKGASGCGLCGIEAIEQSFPELDGLPTAPTLADAFWLDGKAHFNDFQVVGGRSGAIHGAMLLDLNGECIAFAEDIGRHNALDKLIGKGLQQALELAGMHVLMSSRCSTELILKAVRAQFASLGHLASPSTLAVQQAKQYGLHLIHIPRHNEPRHYN